MYSVENMLDEQEFIAVLKASTLAERRPVNEPERIRQMCRHANLIVCARNSEGRLIGIARSLTDFAYCIYLSDLSVDLQYQQQGIGKELIRQTRLAAPQANLILLAAPAATTYYPKIGMQKHDAAFILRAGEEPI